MNAEENTDIKLSVPAEKDVNMKLSVPAEKDVNMKLSVPAEKDVNMKLSVSDQGDAEPNKLAVELANIIRSSVKDCIGREKEIGLLFSGGVDSAILAVIARKFTDVTLYVAGTPDSHDMKVGMETGYILDLPVVPIMISRRKVLSSLEELVRVHGLDEPRWATTFMAFNIVARNIDERLMMSGQGPDELFGGYRKYTRCPVDQAEKMMRQDLDELLEQEVPFYKKIVLSMGRSLSIPFLQPGMVDFAQALPMGVKLDRERNKAVLRSAARVLGVPQAIAERPKKAMQYGTGVSKLLRSYLKERGTTLPDLMSTFL